MKHFLLVALTFHLLNGNAQTILLTNTGTGATVAPNAVINLTTSAGGQTKITLDLKNISASAQDYNVKRYDVTVNTGAVVYFCFSGTCYGAATFSAGPLALAAGQSASQLTGTSNMLTAYNDEAASVGYSLVKYTVSNASNNSDSVQITLRYNTALGVNETSGIISTVDTYPNPASEQVFLKVSSRKETSAKLVVCNAIGLAVIEKVVTFSEGKNSVSVNIEDLPAGVYLVTIKSANASITKKFIVR